jgi:hypothetical protein
MTDKLQRMCKDMFSGIIADSTWPDRKIIETYSIASSQAVKPSHEIIGVLPLAHEV